MDFPKTVFEYSFIATKCLNKIINEAPLRDPTLISYSMDLS